MRQIITIWFFIGVVLVLGPVTAASVLVVAIGYTIGEVVYQGAKLWASYWKNRDSSKAERATTHE